eukprot:TRINITY_DN2526_c0_g1_i2.p1 TRINITY_DN2526_c0_g1~~TRINITY_DN2526_c0_g1_i2.p1  ORF type:complete len:117 (+),score=1.74 TRINITY_DN2526_c0_g1_i2:75-425(+)
MSIKLVFLCVLLVAGWVFVDCTSAQNRAFVRALSVNSRLAKSELLDAPQNVANTDDDGDNDDDDNDNKSGFVTTAPGVAWTGYRDADFENYECVGGCGLRGPRITLAGPDSADATF